MAYVADVCGQVLPGVVPDVLPSLLGNVSILPSMSYDKSPSSILGSTWGSTLGSVLGYAHNVTRATTHDHTFRLPAKQSQMHPVYHYKVVLCVNSQALAKSKLTACSIWDKAIS